MAPSLCLSALTLAVSLLTALPASSQATAETATSSSITVHVIDPSGQVLPGAIVTLEPSNIPSKSLVRVADAEGSVVLPVVREQAYRIRISLGGFMQAQVGPFTPVDIEDLRSYRSNELRVILNPVTVCRMKVVTVR